MAVSEFLNDPGLFVFKHKDGIFVMVFLCIQFSDFSEQRAFSVLTGKTWIFFLILQKIFLTDSRRWQVEKY